MSSTRSRGFERDYAPDQLSIVDDVFGLQPGWVDTFAALIAERNARIPFRCLMRADQIDADIVRALAAAGCRMVWMGAESGSQRVLDAMEKGVRVEQIREAARRLRDAGIQVGMFLQFGYPGEAWDDVEQTLALVRDTSPDDIGVSVSYPLPGTKFYERVRAELGAQAELGRLRRSGDDVPRDLLAAVLSRAASRRASRVPHATARATRQAARRSSRRSWRLPDVRRIAAWAYHRAALPLASFELRRLRTVMTRRTARRRRLCYNPRAVFYTMPLALVALASATRSARGRRRDHRRPSRTTIRSPLSSPQRRARCASASPCSPARRFTMPCGSRAR